MRQILQNLRSGATTVQEVPSPGLGRNTVLIQTRASLISAGAERMLVEFGKAALLAKARAQPDKVNPPLEAMARRCPVLACNVTAMPEVVGDAGMLVEPGNHVQFAEGIVSIYENAYLRQTLVERCLERIRKFRWTSSARKILSLLGTLASLRPAQEADHV